MSMQTNNEIPLAGSLEQSAITTVGESYSTPITRSDNLLLAAARTTGDAYVNKNFGGLELIDPASNSDAAPQTISDTVQQIPTSNEVLMAKWPWERPENPTDAANRAHQEITNALIFEHGVNQAEEWLNDGDSTFRTRSANEWNRLYGQRQWGRATDHMVGSTFRLEAQKINGRIELVKIGN